MAEIYAIVGPSGVGKDTLMQAAKAARPDLYLVRRVVTRSETAGGEDFEGVSEAEFQHRKAAGAFALDWSAHGLSYGIPTEVTEVIAAGRSVLFNGSRRMLAEAACVFPGLKVINVTARHDVLAARLAARGRESAADIEKRLERSQLSLPEGLDVIELDNSGALEEAVSGLLDVLRETEVRK